MGQRYFYVMSVDGRLCVSPPEDPDLFFYPMDDDGEERTSCKVGDRVQWLRDVENSAGGIVIKTKDGVKEYWQA